MTIRVVFRRRFRDDLAAGYDWYEGQRPNLGEEFLSAVRSMVSNIEAYPDVFATVYGEVRRAMIPRFPFAIFYVLEPRRVVALRLLHTARDPELWPQPGR